MYNFWIQTISQYRGLNDWYKGPPYIANFILFPVANVLMWAILGRYAMDAQTAIYFAVGQMISTAAYGIICAATMSYANDRWYSTLTLLYISPASRFLNFTSRAVLNFSIGLVVFVTCMVMIRLTTSVDFGAINWPFLILSLLIVNASILAFSQFLSIFAIIFREWLNTLAFALGIIIVLTGVVIPLSVFPGWVQELGKLIPMTNGLVAVRAAFEGQDFSAAGLDLLREALTGAVYFLAGYLGFIAFERVARKNGAMEMEDIS
jgi:ABC-2 type transport system permease protein